ncbi:ABC transporter substrate-binding protein [Martelella mediterranea]|uniref:Carbohydrate ABC transporter substrate-binding protein (CUT1 family) n=1 Tax=Martelella mediterranea TaxID=293089 RepID=A0A4R3P105_9HYPH|nr:extracellular solute-binding protein [Martelella mediterranea]TCT42811.1 carbohydrate ABC transporter substrate-binding protein (CUT1 family) [Martelella mediterranea]
MTYRLKKALLGAFSVAALSVASPALADTTIDFQRFFGACDADWGDNTDVSAAVGECGIITSLVNKFEEENPDITVNVTTVEWPGYDQLTAQFAAGDPPDVVTIHQSVLGDYVSKNLLMPLNELLEQQGISPESFTKASLTGVTRDGEIYGLPIDNWSQLWHINLALFDEAGLVNEDGTPVLPTSAEELLAQAEQFQEATGKPYFTMPLANETALYTRDFYTYLQQQDADFFADPTAISIETPEAKAVLELYKTLYDEGYVTKDLDYGASLNAFLAGDAGVHEGGTWVIGDYNAESEKDGTALNAGGYTVVPYPQLYSGTRSQYADGHSLAVSRMDRSDEEEAAIGKFLKFIYDNDYDWARTGHLPSVQAVLDSEEFRALPHRETVLEVAEIGTPVPGEVQRQFAIQDIIGQEMNAAMTGQKSIDDALADMQDRVNDLLRYL